MSITSLLGARLGLEELVDEVPDINPAALSTDAEMVEMEKAHQEVVTTETDMSMLCDATDSLERIAVALEKITTPTISMEAADLFNLAYENAMHPIAKYSDNSYSGAMRGGDNTEEQRKTFAQKLKAAWDAFILMMKKLWDAISNFVSRLFSSAASLRRKAEALIKAARPIRNNPNAAAFTMNVNEIQIDGKVPQPSDIVKIAKESGNIYHNVLVGKDSLLNKTFVDSMKKAIDDLGADVDINATLDEAGDKKKGHVGIKDIENLRAFLKNSTAKLAASAGIGKDPGSELAKTLGDGLFIKISKDTLPGDRVMVFSISNGKDLKPDDHSDFVKYIKSVNFDIVHNKEKALERAEIKPMEIKDLVDVLSTVVNTCIDLEAFNKEWFQWIKAVAVLQDTFVKHLSKKINSIYVTDAERQKYAKQGIRPEDINFKELDAVKAINSIVMSMFAVTQKIGSFEGKVAKQAMRNSHALVVYAGKSLNAHIGNPNDDFEAGPNATKNSKGYQEHERAAPGSKGFTSSRDDIDDAVLV